MSRMNTVLENKPLIIRLFNSGKLTATDAEWYERRGYQIVMIDDVIMDIVWKGVD